jgi:hypothetical protein
VVLLAATVVTEPFSPADYVVQHVEQNGRPMLWLARYLDSESLRVVAAITLPAGEVAVGRCRSGSRLDRRIVALLRPGTATVTAAWRADPSTEKITPVPTTSVSCPPRS